MIKIYILEGCDKCKKLKSTLDKLKLEYECTVCEENPNDCDRIEAATGVDMYPIVYSKGSLLYVAESYKDIGKKKMLNENLSSLGFYSIDNIIEFIKKD